MTANKLDAPEVPGVPIVLTASTIEMSDFNLNPFMAFTGGFPTKIVPRKLLRKSWYPPTPNNEDGTAVFAPYGLRKVEALLKKEFGDGNVVVAQPDNLDKFVGKNTKVIGISTMDPCGIGFVSRTYTSLVGFGGEPLAAAEFRELVNHSVFKNNKIPVIVGGSGAWQIERAKMREKLGIDTVVIGEGESTVVDLFKKTINGEKLPPIIETDKTKGEDVPTIVNASLYGTVEIMRGCGRGCQFCSPTMRHRISFPLEHIMKEVKINAQAGSKMIILTTEDLFLYQSKEHFMPNREAIYELLSSIAKVPGVNYIQPAHASLAPVLLDKKMIEEIAPILVEKGKGRYNSKPYGAVEIGVETGSIRLMEKYMKGKMLPYKPKDWPEIVVQALGILNDNTIYPLCTLITGLPDETEEDTLQTMGLLDRLKGFKIFYVPLFFTSEEECLLSKARQADLSNLTQLQMEFIAKCWRHNINIWVRAERKPLIMLGSLFAYAIYYRWKHGKKVFRPILIMSGWEDFFFGRRISITCEPRYCMPKETQKP